MRIAIIADAVDRNNAGISQYVRQLVMNLKERHELTVVHLKKSNDPVFVGVEEVIVPRLFRSPGLVRMYVALFLRSLNVDVMHHPSAVGSFIFPMRFKTIQTVHDAVPFKFPETRTLVNRLIYMIFTKPSLRNVDAIITVSECSKRDICSILGVSAEKIHVTLEASSYKKPSAGDVKRVCKQYGILYPYFLFVGTFEPRKNIVRMLEAFAKSGLNHHFLLVGSRGWKDEDIFRAISRLNLRHSVHVLSGVPNSDIAGLYGGASALVFASLYEGFGLPVVEAMSCGCPVITSRNSSLPEVAGDAALYVDPFNVDDIANAMKIILKRRAFFVRKGFIQARKFSWNKTAEQTVKVYEKILGR